MSTTEVLSKDATSDLDVARVDTKLEIVVIPVSDIDRRRSSTRASGGGSTPTTTTAPISA